MSSGAFIMGSSGRQADVTVNKELKTCNPTGIHRASVLGDAYSWNAISANIDTTDCMILVCNKSSSRLLVISYCMFEGDIVGQMDFKLAECSGLTLAGTAITGVCLNRALNKTAPASAFADETASPAATVFYTHAQSLPYAGVAGIMNTVDFHDSIILGLDDAFGIDTILEPAAGFEATVFGYYIDA
ncbi:MAG: hypothetical protein ACYS30_25040 [Planctomycetota bacterium]|jgi:hypothetical protein